MSDFTFGNERLNSAEGVAGCDLCSLAGAVERAILDQRGRV